MITVNFISQTKNTTGAAELITISYNSFQELASLLIKEGISFTVNSSATPNDHLLINRSKPVEKQVERTKKSKIDEIGAILE